MAVGVGEKESILAYRRGRKRLKAPFASWTNQSIGTHSKKKEGEKAEPLTRVGPKKKKRREPPANVGPPKTPLQFLFGAAREGRRN